MFSYFCKIVIFSTSKYITLLNFKVKENLQYSLDFEVFFFARMEVKGQSYPIRNSSEKTLQPIVVVVVAAGFPLFD